MHRCMGHTAWAPKGREGRSQADPKGLQLQVGARRAPRLLVLHTTISPLLVLKLILIQILSHHCPMGKVHDSPATKTKSTFSHFVNILTTLLKMIILICSFIWIFSVWQGHEDNMIRYPRFPGSESGGYFHNLEIFSRRLIFNDPRWPYSIGIA